MQNGIMRRVKAYLIFNPNPNSEVENQLNPIIVKARDWHILKTTLLLMFKIKHGNIFSHALKNHTHTKCNYINCLKIKIWNERADKCIW